MMVKAPPGKLRCALTFDDGPDPVWTPAVINGLGEHDLRATFFVVGSLVSEHPGLIAHMLDAGHEVGIHCMQHVRHTELSEAEIAADTDASLRVLARAGGAPPTYWRTPWGVETDATRSVAAERGLQLVGWDADTHDWRGDGATAMHAVLAPRLTSGPVILMHDGIGPGARRDDCLETVELIGKVARTLRHEGIAAVPVGEWAA
jgi:peptidoglycan/xylan/chitin deacetylase (PgdA/CDA1 family)